MQPKTMFFLNLFIRHYLSHKYKDSTYRLISLHCCSTIKYRSNSKKHFYYTQISKHLTHFIMNSYIYLFFTFFCTFDYEASIKSPKSTKRLICVIHFYSPTTLIKMIKYTNWQPEPN